ncbi:lysoplasmalogenase [Leucobacter viscericola]|uniref:Lysoplasmalogenase n=2 Tax=Leucobacter viscericola TaxID=2714935 RepID=A0A6G7XJW8_9MICO|nr:lysoplasmalogenase [Leucobacter viscericola]
MPGSIRPWLAFTPYIVVSVVHVVARFFDLPVDAPTKLMLMPALALAAVWVTASLRPWPRGEMVLLLAAILFSWLGDGASVFFPMFEDPLPMMLLCFGLAHVGYMVLMLRGRGLQVRRFPMWAIVYVLAYGVLMALLLPHTGALTIPVSVYGLLLVGTAAVASRCGTVVAWGGAWFLASDAILAFRIFTPEMMPDWTSGLVMLTYTLGQGLIVFGVTAALRRRAQQLDPQLPRPPRGATATAY